MTVFVNNAPAAPTGVVLIGGTKQITVKWTQCNEIDYRYTIVQYATTVNGAYTEFTRIAGSSVDITGLTNSTTYYVKIAHADSFGDTGLNWSTPISTSTDNFNSLVDARIGTAVINGSQLVGQSVPATALSTEALYAPLAVIGDVRNICLNPIGDRGTSGWVANNFTAGVGVVDWVNFVSDYKGNSAFTQDDRDAIYGDFVPVNTNDEFWLSCVVVPRGGATANYDFNLGLVLYDKNKQPIAYPPAANRPAASTGGTKLIGTLKITNTSAAYVKVWTQINKTAGTNTSGTNGDGYHFSNVIVVRKNKGELIVDGTITGNHIAANTITADKIDSRGLSIKDVAGNVLFAAGTSLTPDLIDIGRVGNLLVNTENRSGESPLTRGWTNVKTAALNAETTVSCASIIGGISSWYPDNTNPFVIQQNGVAGSQSTDYAQLQSDAVPVIAGKRYEASVYLQAHRCQVILLLRFYDAAGTQLASNQATQDELILTAGGTAKYLSNWGRLSIFRDAPANAAFCRLIVRKWATYDVYTSGDSWAFILNPYVGNASTGQTTPSPYSPGSEWVPFGTIRPDNQITATNATTYIASAAIGDAQVGVLSASKIDTRGLTVKDAAGNIILSSGQPLNPTYINLGLSSNLLTNTENNANEPPTGTGAGGYGWTGYASVGLTVSQITVSTEQLRNPGNPWQWQPINANATVIVQTGISGSQNTDYYDLYSDAVPISSSTRYEISARLVSHRCKSQIWVVWYDNSGAYISASQIGVDVSTAAVAPKDKNTWSYQSGFATSPSNAVSAKFLFRKFTTITGNTDSIAWMLEPYFGNASLGQTTPSPYSPGAEWVPNGTIRPDNKITTGNIGTYLNTAVIGTAYISDLAVSTGKIQDLAVGTLKIAGEAASIVRSYDAVGTYTGVDNTTIRCIQYAFTLPHPAKCVFWWWGKLNETAPNKPKGFSMRADANATIGGGTLFADTGSLTAACPLPSLVGFFDFAAGNHNVAIEWASSTDNALMGQKLIMLYSMR